MGPVGESEEEKPPLAMGPPTLMGEVAGRGVGRAQTTRQCCEAGKDPLVPGAPEGIAADTKHALPEGVCPVVGGEGSLPLSKE